MIKSVMLALSGSPYTPVATRYAMEIASSCGAAITGVSFIDAGVIGRQTTPTGGIALARTLAEQQLVEARERIAIAEAKLIGAAREHGIEHRIVSRDGDPIHLFIDEWRYHDVTVFGLRGLFDYKLIPEPEHVLNRLISSGVRPILAVAEQYRPVRSALVAVSGSLTAAKALKRYLQMRLWPRAGLHLVHFGSTTPAMRDHLQRSADYCQRHGYGVIGTSILEGDPRGELLGYAERVKADLIVMGDSARNLLSRELFGDTALHVVTHADRPLFLSH